MPNTLHTHIENVSLAISYIVEYNFQVRYRYRFGLNMTHLILQLHNIKDDNFLNDI